MNRLARGLGACLMALVTFIAHAGAQDTYKQALQEAQAAALPGPQDVALAGQATLKLPAKHAFIPQPQAGKLLTAMGNPGRDERLQGLIVPGEDQGWFMTVRYEPSSYIKDDDAKNWNADELLKSYRDGTEASNAERQKMGVPELEILGWAEKPSYDAATHRLVWAMSSREKGASQGEPQGVNYNTYVLGREGYISMNLVTGLDDLPAHKPAAQTLLESMSFNTGKTYGDFNASTDHIAEYGLAALVLGVGAKKLGLLALAGAFVLKFAKLILLGLAGLGAAASRLLRRKAPAPAGPEAGPPAA